MRINKTKERSYKFVSDKKKKYTKKRSEHLNNAGYNSMKDNETEIFVISSFKILNGFQSSSMC